MTNDDAVWAPSEGMATPPLCREAGGDFVTTEEEQSDDP